MMVSFGTIAGFILGMVGAGLWWSLHAVLGIPGPSPEAIKGCVGLGSAAGFLLSGLATIIWN